MAAKNPKAGRGSCPTCKSSVVFRRSPSSGRITFACDECDSSGYADKGGAADLAWSRTITQPIAAPAPAPDPAPAPPAPAAKAKGSPPPAPPPAAPRAAFELSQL